MIVSLRPVTVANRGDLDEIDVGEEVRYWVHSNWYWHQCALDNPNILFRLIHLAGEECAVGMVAFGPAYTDEQLTQAQPGIYEIIHLVLDQRYRGRGIGKQVATAVLLMLAAQPDCTKIIVAHNPANLASRQFFQQLGFLPTADHNYDGDPLLEITKAAALHKLLSSVAALNA